MTEPLRCRGSHLDWGTVLSTNRKMAFSEGSWMRFLMIHMNWATVMSEGTRYFLLSMSTICDPDTFSTITWRDTRRETTITADTPLNRSPVNLPRCLWGDTHRDPVRVLVADFGGLYASMFWWTEKTSHVNYVIFFPGVSTEIDVSESDFLFCTDTRRGAVMDEGRYLNCELWDSQTAAVD